MIRFKMCSAAVLFLAAAIPSVLANVKPAAIFNDNMVLQRNAVVPVWGSADPGETVTVSFAGQTKNAVADANGDWEVRFSPLALNKTGADMTIKGKNTVELKNILVGDVWLCSGQSNMEMSFTWGIMDGGKFIAESEKYPQIRRVKVSKRISDFPQKDIPLDSAWSVCSPKTVSAYTATGYFFARALTRELDSIPIGIIDDNWSGCQIQPFIAPEGFRAVPDFFARYEKLRSNIVGTPQWKEQRKALLEKTKVWLADAEKKYADGKEFVQNMPKIETIVDSRQYNVMIAPITRFPIKGAIWYQGCSNSGEKGDTYYKYMVALVEGWRKVWNNPDMPFYFVQLAAYTRPTNDPEGGNGYAWIREQQRKSLSIPKTGMACTIDIGDTADIHPKNKIDVGERLALWALAKTYGKQGIVYSGPMYKGMKIEGNKIRLEFDYADGLMTATKNKYDKPVAVPNAKPSNFAVRGKDGKWAWADAVIEGKTIVVSAPGVNEPNAVRYAYRACPVGLNVYNAAGLPMVPFRTDEPVKK